MDFANYTPGKPLLKAVRASLMLQDSSLSAWAKKNGIKRQNLTKAITGEWAGPKAANILSQLLADTIECEER